MKKTGKQNRPFGCRGCFKIIRSAWAKKAGILSLASVLAFGASGCGSTNISLTQGIDKINLEVSWWGNDERSRYTIEGLKEYSTEHPEIKIKMIYGEYTGFETKNDVKMFSNTEADIMQINYQWMDKYQRQGLEFYDLRSLSDVLDLSQYDETQLSYGTNAEGRLVALPISLNAKVVWYNQSLYEKYGLELPKTWDDLFAAAKVMSKDGVYPLDMDDYSAWMASVAYTEQLTGHAVFDKDSNFTFTIEDLEIALEFYQRLVEEKVVERAAERDEAKFGQGIYAAMMHWASGSQKYVEMVTNNGQKAAVALSPSMNGEKRMGWYEKPAFVYMIGSHTENPKEAGKLLSYIVQGKGMISRQALEKGVPCNSKAVEILQEDGVLEGLSYDAARLCKEKKYPLMSPYLEDSSAVFRIVADEVIYGQTSVRKAAEKAYEQLIKIGK